MNPVREWALQLAALLVLAVALAWCAVGCRPAADPLAAVYGAERAACVKQNDTPEAARACFRAVDERWRRVPVR